MKTFAKAHVTLCSSSRFYSQVEDIRDTLEGLDLKVYTPRLDFNETKIEVSETEKFSLTREFLQKVGASDAIYIVNPGGYVGMSVAIETGYAFALGKKVFAMSKPSEPAVEALLTKIAQADDLVDLLI